MNNTYESLYIAVDIGGTTIKIGVCAPGPASSDGTSSDRFWCGGLAPGSLSAEWLCRSVIPTDTADHGKNILPDTGAEILRLIGEAGLSADQIAGIGIGVPGPVVTKAGKQVVNGCVNLDWEGLVDVIGEMRSMTDIEDICILNDANAAALGEYYFGPASESDASFSEESSGSAVMVALGTGIGCGIIQSGRIVEGAFGAAGEIGHMPVDPTHPFLQELRQADPGIPGRSDLEHFVSAISIGRLAKKAVEVFPDDTILRSGPPVTTKVLFDAAKEGDAFALRITDFFFDVLAQGLAAVTSVIDPDLYIIGGGLSGAGDFLLDGLSSAYRDLVFPPSAGTEFRLAQLGNDAGLLGSIVPLLDH